MKKEWKEKVKKCFIGFFILMVILTIISRSAASLTVARVSVVRPTRTSLIFRIEGEGTVTSDQETYQDIYSGVRVKKLHAVLGKQVKTGDLLLQLDTGDLSKVLEEEELALQKMELEQKAESIQKDTKNTSALESAELTYQAAVNDLHRAEITYTAAQLEHQAAAEALEKVKKEKDKVKIEEQEAVVEGKRNTVIQEENNVYEKQKALQQANLLLEQSKRDLELSSENEKKDKEAAGLKQKAAKLDIDQKKKRIEQLKNMMEEKGEVTSEYTGIITKINVTEGSKFSGETYAFAVNEGTLNCKMELGREEAKYIEIGDFLSCQLPGSTKQKKAVVTKIEYPDNKEGKAEVTASLEEGNYMLGSEISYTIEKSSDVYETCIPLEAVKEDGSGKYVLVTEEVDTVLGKEQKAVRINVSLLETNGTLAALDGALYEEQVIQTSNKEIREGSRIRLAE